MSTSVLPLIVFCCKVFFIEGVFSPFGLSVKLPELNINTLSVFCTPACQGFSFLFRRATSKFNHFYTADVYDY